MDSPHDFNGMTAPARLRRDIISMDTADMCGRIRAPQKTTHTLSLAADRPFSFAALKHSGWAIFHTELEDFDHANPGAYMQMIKVRCIINFF